MFLKGIVLQEDIIIAGMSAGVMSLETSTVNIHVYHKAQ